MGSYTEGQPFDCPHPLGLLSGSPAPSRGCPNDCNQRLATLLKPHRPMLSRVRCIAWFCAPSVIVRRRIFRAFRKEPNDSPSQRFLDLSISRHGLGHTRGWIAIPVVLASMPHQDATAGFDRSDQIDSFHGITNSPTLRAPGIWPPERSR